MWNTQILEQDEIDALNAVIEDRSRQAGRVLLVDDDIQALHEMQELLLDEGIDCLGAHGIHDAMQALRTYPDIDLLITDLHLCNDNGLELVRHLRDSEQGLTPVIMVSGTAGLEDAIEAMRLHVIDFMVKPLDVPHLLTVIRSTLGMVESHA